MERFGCGKDSLDRFLHKFAWNSQQAGGSQTYVAVDGDELVGYYSLAVGEVAYEFDLENVIIWAWDSGVRGR